MIKGIEHFSFTVSSLEDSLEFFCDKLGLEATPIQEVDHTDVKQIVGMPDARWRICLVKLPDDKNIELIQYIQPKGKSLDLTTSNADVVHIAFEVSAITTLYNDLSSQEVTFVNPPVWARSNDGHGQWGVCSLKGPDHITVELIEKKK